MHLWVILIIGAAIFVAYSAGATDNFKGVATFFGIGAVNGQARWTVTPQHRPGLGVNPPGRSTVGERNLHGVARPRR